MGQPLALGDVIAYGVSSSGHISMSLGIIVEQGATTARASRGPRPTLTVLRTVAQPRGESDRRVSRATLTELQRVVKIHPEYYNEAAARLVAAREELPCE